MANEKKEKDMTPVHQTIPTKVLELKITELSPKQKVLNLDTNEDMEIAVISKRYELPKYDKAIHGEKPEFLKAAMIAAEKLVQPIDEQIDALLYRATQSSYQAGKTLALSGGNFLTSDLRGKIVQIMRANAKFADESASDCFKMWLAGYKEKKTGAVKILTMAQDFGDFDL